MDRRRRWATFTGPLAGLLSTVSGIVYAFRMLGNEAAGPHVVAGAVLFSVVCAAPFVVGFEVLIYLDHRRGDRR